MKHGEAHIAAHGQGCALPFSAGDRDGVDIVVRA